MQLKVKKAELFEKWLEWLNPIIPLKTRERKVLAAYITLHYLHKDRVGDPKILNSLLFSEDTKLVISKRLNISIKQINSSIQVLKRLNLVKENALNPSLTKYPYNDKFSIKIDFIIDES